MTLAPAGRLWKQVRPSLSIGCPPGIRTPIGCSRGSCPTIERGGNTHEIAMPAVKLAVPDRTPEATNHLDHNKGIPSQGQTVRNPCASPRNPPTRAAPNRQSHPQMNIYQKFKNSTSNDY